MNNLYKDKCTYIIKTACDAPGFDIPSNLSSETTNLQISYLEYDPLYTTMSTTTD